MSVPDQKDAIATYCRRHDLPDPTFYCDLGVSGSVNLSNREAGRRLLADLKKGDILVITKMDRMFRNMADLCESVERFQKKEYVLHIVDFNGSSIDLGSMYNRLMIHMMGAFAEFERCLIAERTSKGIQSIKARGERHTNSPGYGYRWQDMWTKDEVTGKSVYRPVRVNDPKERAIMEDIVRWYHDGWSFDKITMHLAHGKMGDGTFGVPCVNKLNGQRGRWSADRVKRMYKAQLEFMRGAAS